ncbi:MAG: hypothetical protein Q7K54_00845 [Candidatus Parcubacteria bacterium]|nr:hypothetical protein [Candidatus Parcubacteria bacterium]
MPNNFPKLALPLSIAFFVFFCTAFYFLYQKVNENNVIAEENNTVWQNEANRRDILSSMDRSIKAIAPEIAQLEKHFAQSSDVVPFLNSIENMARAVGVKAEFTSVEVPKDSIVLVVAMDATGSFEQMYKFLTLLENSPYQIEFNKVEIKRSSEIDVPLPVGTRPVWSGFFKMSLLSFTK